MMDFKVELMSVDLHGIYNNLEPSIKHRGKIISINNGDRVVLDRVFHCDGLFLCVSCTTTSLVVWNPNLGETRWIESRHANEICERYALGYEKKKNKSLSSLKILRFMDDRNKKPRIKEYEIYSFKSDSWKVVDFSPHWDLVSCQFGVSLKGNTYWLAREKQIDGQARESLAFLICFDFTREEFGPHLLLPFHAHSYDTVTLSNVREEQLAVLFQRRDTLMLEIWATTKIEPRKVSWNKLFLAFNMIPLTGFQFGIATRSFIIDEKNETIMVLGRRNKNISRIKAYIIGRNGHFKQVDIGESKTYRCPLVCSYVPNSVQISQPKRLINQHRTFWFFGFSLFLCILLSNLYSR